MFLKCLYNFFCFLALTNAQTFSIEKFQKSEQSFNTAKGYIEKIMHNRNELEKRLITSNTYLREHMERETKALNKIQEVLLVAETAINEKNAAIQREKDIKEECDHLASIIGQIMEDAAKKVELDMDERHRLYVGKIKKLEMIIEKVCIRAFYFLIYFQGNPGIPFFLYEILYEKLLIKYSRDPGREAVCVCMCLPTF